jgi:prolyl-tRNA synthetase
VVRNRQDEDPNEGFALILLRADHELNAIKAARVIGPFRFASDAEIARSMQCPAGYLGPANSGEVPVFADRFAMPMSDFVCGANKEGFHLGGANWGAPELPEPAQERIADFRNVVAGDQSPDGKGPLEIVRGIEVGHIFQLRTKYSQMMKATFLDESGSAKPYEMGCYGIGITRIVGAAIEQGHDEKGIIFPPAIAPFSVALAAIGYHKSDSVREAANALHEHLVREGVDVLLDDRDERPGVMFSDLELLGIPHRITIGERGLKQNIVEYQSRHGGDSRQILLGDAAKEIKKILC